MLARKKAGKRQEKGCEWVQSAKSTSLSTSKMLLYMGSFNIKRKKSIMHRRMRKVIDVMFVILQLV
jgi:hypothetical protein